MKDYDKTEYESFKKWVDSVSCDIIKPKEAERVVLLMLNKLFSGEKLVDGKFIKLN